MDESSLHQRSKMEESSDPKPNAVVQVRDIVPKGKCTTPGQLETATAEDVKKGSAEAKAEEYDSVGAKMVQSAEDSTKLLSCEDFLQDVKLCGPGPMELQAETSTGILSSPKKVALAHTHIFGSEMVNNEALKENHVIATETTDHRPVKDQKSEFDHINMEQKGTVAEEVPQNSCLKCSTSPIYNQSRNFSGDQLGLPPDNAAKDCKHVQSGQQIVDVTKIAGLEQLVPGQKTAARIPSQLAGTGKRPRGRPRKGQNPLTSLGGSVKVLPENRKDTQELSVNSSGDQLGLSPDIAAKDCKHVQLGQQIVDVTKIAGLQQLVPGQKTAANSPIQLADMGKRPRGRPRKGQNPLTSLGGSVKVLPEKRKDTQELSVNSSSDQLGLPPDIAVKDCKHVQLGQQIDDVTKIAGLQQLVPDQKMAAQSPSQLADTGKRPRGRPRKGQYLPTSLGGSVKVLPEKRKDNRELSVNSSRSLRSRSQEKSNEPNLSNVVAEDGADREKKRKKRKKRMEENRVDEFSRVRTHLRYLLHRIQYEKNFIDAYSGEGWKGQSLDKIKPEKELQKAKSEIFGRKLKIRDLFQRLDISRSKGRLPEILFGSQGEIDSEDIFCAKCGSKDVTLSNDIILCDGACERGFHQFCLDPPLLKEYIPPDDVGWLCPGCECKVDCIKLLNDSQETNILVGDSWEKIFAEEAAAAASGKNLDDNSGLPSDDSDDDDYDPGGPDLDEKVQGDESSSDESDYHSASDDMRVLPKKEPCLGLPPNDSEDDDYDPTALVIDQIFKEDSSSSDFTSDSEDITVMFNSCKHSGEVQGPPTSNPDHVRNNEEGCTHPEQPEQGDVASLYPRRQVNSLDYKKLHDEEYGNTSSDSSDEDYMVTASPNEKKYTDKEATVLPNFEGLTTVHGKESGDLELDQKESESTHKRRYKKKFDIEGTNSSLARSCKGSAAPVTSGKSTSTTLYGEHATQRLLQSFEENQYPQRAVKESLAAELALSVRQVSKWFNNTRWSFRHSSRMASGVAEIASNEGTPHQKSINLSASCSKSVSYNATCSEVEKKEQDKGSPGVTECCDRHITLNIIADEVAESSQKV